MNSQEARFALFEFVGPRPDSEVERELNQLLDAYALAVHVEACGAVGGVSDRERGQEWTDCGDGWYCSQAPRR